MEHDWTEVGERARALRERAKLTQANVAEAAGVTDQTVSRLECGQPPALRTLRSIAEILGTTAGALLDGGKVVAPAPANSIEVRQLAGIAAKLSRASRRSLLVLAKQFQTLEGTGRPRKKH
jgi:transcriptional regulator with XRE-family HTH domain